jgi:outer membrane protein OmpA-like peptidoglycan-associated protein
MGGIGMAGVGGVVFYDYDGDGTLGPQDSVAPGIGLLIGGQRRITDARGRYRTWNVVPYELVEVSVDTLRGMPPNWIPLRVQQYMRATPHMYNRFDIPLAQTHEVAGRIVPDSGIWTAGGVTVLFEDLQSGAKQSTVTFSDGAFYVSRMRPGHYEMSVAPAALEALGAHPSGERVRFEIPRHAGDELIDLAPLRVRKAEQVEQAVVVKQSPKCPGVAPETPVDSLGCPIVLPRRVLTLRDVTFERNRMELTKGSYEVLDSIAEALKESPEIRIEIAGHTDATGSRARNIALSEARAAAVRRYFISRGVDSARMEVRGYGPDQPVASNLTEEGRAQNRRTELRRLDDARKPD